MKTTIYMLALLYSVVSYGQENKVDKLEVTPQLINGFLVKEFPQKNSEIIYDKLKKWIEYNIKNPEFSLKNDVENEYLKFKISKVGGVYWDERKKAMWTLALNVELRIKDDKVRLDITEIEINGVNEELPILVSANGLTNSIFRGDGKQRKGYDYIRQTTNESLNNFAEEIFNSIDGNPDYKKDNW